MMINKDSFRIALTYIGAIVGAGFATGQEIYQFFTIFKAKGLLGSLFATIGFVVFAIMYLDIVYNKPIYSYNDLLKLLVGEKLAKLFDLSISLFLFGSYTIMLAAAYSLLNTYVFKNSFISYFLVIAVVLLSLNSGVKGIVKINTYLIPVLVIVIFILCILNLNISIDVFSDTGLVPQNYLFSSITYVSYNLIIGMVVLSSLKEEIYTKKTIILAPLISGVLMGVMLVLITAATARLKDPSEIPILDLAVGFNETFYGILIIGIGIAILTSALASGYGLINRLSQSINIKYPYMVTIITFLAIPLSLYGFEALIKFVYPLFGFINLIVMLLTIRFYIKYRFKGFYRQKK